MKSASFRCSLAALGCGLLCTVVLAQVKPKPRRPLPIKPLPLQPAKIRQTQTATQAPAALDEAIETLIGQPTDTPAIDAFGGMAPEEAARIIAIHNALPPDEQEAMRSLYLTQDIDLLALIAAHLQPVQQQGQYCCALMIA